MKLEAKLLEKIGTISAIERATSQAQMWKMAVGYLPNGEWTAHTDPFEQGFPEYAIFSVHVPHVDPGTPGKYVSLMFVRVEMHDERDGSKVFVYVLPKHEEETWRDLVRRGDG